MKKILDQTIEQSAGVKLSFSKDDLLNAMQIVQSSVSTKSTLPILANVLITVQDASRNGNAGTIIEATDLEVGVRCVVKAEVFKEGKITVPAKKFGDLVREMPSGKDIELSSADGKRIEFKCGKVKATLNALSAEDFPVIPEFPEKKSFQVKKSVFRDMIKKTSFAVSTDETRYVLNGIFFSATAGELKMVATDGRRLAFLSRKYEQKELSASVIIPAKAINELARLLALSEDESEDWIQIAPHENQVAFRWMNRGESITLVSRVIDGAFPNYDQVIPKSKEFELKIKKEDIFPAVKRAALFAQDRGGSVRFSLSNNALRISANSQGLGEEEEEIEVPYAGKDFEIAFNPVFLLDVLKNSDSSEIRFEFSSSLNPGLIRPTADDSYICVIMPMRLQ